MFDTQHHVMAERDRQIDREVDTDLDVDIPGETVDESPSEASRAARTRARIRKGAGKVISGRAFLLSLVLTLGGLVLIGGFLPLGTIGDLLGILVAAFLYGSVTDVNRYVELGLAGGLVGGGSALVGNLVLSLIGPGAPIVIFGAIAGGLAGVLGHYFGRDLRDGLTRDI